MTANTQQTTSYEGWIEDLAYELAGEYAMHGDGEPRAHSVLEDAVMAQLSPVSDERLGELDVPAYLWDDPDPAGRTRLLLYALYESFWPWSPSAGYPDRALIVEADERGHAYVVAVSGRKEGEKIVVFSEDVALRTLICRNTEDLRALYGRLRDKVEGRDLPGALRGRREHLTYAPLFEWTGADGAGAGIYHLCEDCAADRSLNAHDPVQKGGPLECLMECEDCGAVNREDHPEGKLPILVGYRKGQGSPDEIITRRVEFPMELHSAAAPGESPSGVIVEDEAALLRWAKSEFESYRISFV